VLWLLIAGAPGSSFVGRMAAINHSVVSMILKLKRAPGISGGFGRQQTTIGRLLAEHSAGSLSIWMKISKPARFDYS
jgi:hypothetical protein